MAVAVAAQTGMPDMQLKKLARKGIPAGLRAVVWGRAVHLPQILNDNMGKYGQPPLHAHDYSRLSLHTSPRSSSLTCSLSSVSVQQPLSLRPYPIPIT